MMRLVPDHPRRRQITDRLHRVLQALVRLVGPDEAGVYQTLRLVMCQPGAEQRLPAVGELLMLASRVDRLNHRSVEGLDHLPRRVLQDEAARRPDRRWHERNEPNRRLPVALAEFINR